MIHDNERKASEGVAQVSATGVVGNEAIPGARSGGDPSPAGSGLMEPSGLCRDTRCLWNQSDQVLESLGAPAGWTWPHRHDGEAVVLLMSYG